MLLILTTIDQQGQHKEFICSVSTLDYALDVASEIAGKSHRLLSVSVTDKATTKMQFPVVVFDGDSFSEPMKQLENQWQQILSKPINHQAVYTQWLVALARQHITSQQTRIGNLEEAITRQEHLLTQLKGPTNYITRRTNKCTTQLDMYQRQLACAQLNHGLAVSRLEEYQSR